MCTMMQAQKPYLCLHYLLLYTFKNMNFVQISVKIKYRQQLE